MSLLYRRWAQGGAGFWRRGWGQPKSGEQSEKNFAHIQPCRAWALRLPHHLILIADVGAVSPTPTAMGAGRAFCGRAGQQDRSGIRSGELLMQPGELVKNVMVIHTVVFGGGRIVRFKRWKWTVFSLRGTAVKFAAFPIARQTPIK